LLSSIAGRRAAATASPRSPPSLSSSRSMSSSRGAAQSTPQSRRHQSSRLSSRWGRIPSVPASFRVWHDRVAMSPACRPSKPISLASDSNFCANLPLVCTAWRSWPMVPSPCWKWARLRPRPRLLGLEVTPLEIHRAEDIAPAFEALKGHADALYLCTDALINSNRVRINTLALAARLPTMHGNRESVPRLEWCSIPGKFHNSELVFLFLRGAQERSRLGLGY
jgi:hypothetical protein